MIYSLTLKQFRNFSHKEISFCAGKNIIIGKNGQGKSNILEALSLPVTPLFEDQLQYLVQKESHIFFLSYLMETGKLGFSYESLTKKKKYLNNEKSTTKQKLSLHYPHVVSFHPFGMNLMYLGPSERRNFLDTALTQAFPEYIKILQDYKKILIHRNKVLKNISVGKSTRNELDFWDTKFIEYALCIYRYRKKIIDFFQDACPALTTYFFGKVQDISFKYISKISIDDIQTHFSQEFLEQREKEILLRKTLRGPHLDDFTLLLDGVIVSHFASRGELKSILLGLKFIESEFLESFSEKKEILFLIDDLLSELDTQHRDMLWKHIGKRQCIISSIEDFEVDGNKIYI